MKRCLYLLITFAIFINFSAVAEPWGRAPEFILENLNGGETSLESLKGKAVILNFWATWCVPCKIEMPLLEKTHQKYKGKGLVVIGVNYRESAPIIKSFMTKNSLSIPVLLDPEGELADEFNIMGLPATFFINRNGDVIGSHTGLISPSTLDSWITKLLG